MSFANWNLLSTVLSQIPKSQFQYRQFSSAVINEFGQSVASYGAWQDGVGSVQPVNEANEHVEGLDLSKKSVAVWIYGVMLKGTNDQTSPDQIKYMGKIYNVVSVEDWFAYDNYCKCICQEVQNGDGT